MNPNHISRRHFIRWSTMAAAAAAAAHWPELPAASSSPKRYASDQVALGNTGIKLSRLGFGTGSNSGNVQRNLGKDGFSKLIHYAFDHGITYFDCALSYRTHEWIGEAVKGIPRDKIFIQTKIGGNPDKTLEVIDKIRLTYDMDYVDSLLVHCTITPKWDEERKRIMDDIAEAQSKQWLRARGVSCHSLPALRRATEIDWVQVHLVRVNPQGAWVDTPAVEVMARSEASHVPSVMEQIKAMRAKGRGIIGMKLIGNGEFTKAEDREKAMQFAMQCGLLDSVVIGFKSTDEIDESIDRMNRALAATA